MADDPGTPKIQIDTDWKAQAQKEKERLAKQEQEKSKTAPGAGTRRPSGSGLSAGSEGEDAVGSARTPGAGAGALPQADFRTLVGMLASQAVMGLGAMADEKTGRVVVDLEGARFSIDLLDVLEQKTKGNLAKDETDEIKQILAELRSRYVQISNLVARQMAAQATAQMKAAEQNLTT